MKLLQLAVRRTVQAEIIASLLSALHLKADIRHVRLSKTKATAFGQEQTSDSSQHLILLVFTRPAFTLDGNDSRQEANPCPY